MVKKSILDTIDKDEIKAATAKIDAIWAGAKGLNEPERMKFIYGKLDELSKRELYVITATVAAKDF